MTTEGAQMTTERIHSPAIELIFTAPLCTLVGDTVHAVTVEVLIDALLADAPAALVTACGVATDKLMAAASGRAVLWPPYAAPLKPLGWSRCRECMTKAGKRQPRSEIRRVGGE
jgi:hypothetical protein